MKTIPLAIAAAALLASGSAHAADKGSWRVGGDSFHIYYEDLDMNTAPGRAALLQRVERAAGKLCDLPLRADAKACAAEVIASAAGSVHGSALRVAIVERDHLRLAGR